MTTLPGSTPPDSPGTAPSTLVAAMTLDQKIAQLHGAMETIDIYALSAQAMAEGADLDQLAAQIRVDRHVAGIDELGIPRFRVTNGPVGVGMGDGTPSPPATSLPMTIGLAAGFDPELAHAYGDIIGSETATLGQHVLEGPGVCLHRTPIAGRNFEYFSEDPYLSGVMGVAVATAIQAHDVIAMAKHFAVNDQEYERFRASVEIDEHVLRELYLLPFEMLVKDADIAAVMSAYNRVRGTYATENRYLLTDVLRTRVGFRRLRAVRLLVLPFRGSLAARRHGPRDARRQVAQRGQRQGRSERHQPGDRDGRPGPGPPFHPDVPVRPVRTALSTRCHRRRRTRRVARRIGGEIAVLLKNDEQLLPLSADVADIVIIGQSTFVDDACLGGGGSSKVIPLYTVPPLRGIQDVLADLGSCDQSSPRSPLPMTCPTSTRLDGPRGSASVVVLMAGLIATEGADQPDANMLNDQNTMLDQLLGLNPATVVVLKDSNPVLMPWIGKASTVLEVWNQGSEDGHVVADLLFGVVNPSGKVPTSYPVTEDDTLYAEHPERYPGTDEGDGYPVIRYSEGLQMGYRWHQSQQIEPLFGFGHGLSYTTFDLADVAVSAPRRGERPGAVSATVTNTGPSPAPRSSRSTSASRSTASRRNGSSASPRCSCSPGSPEPTQVIVDPAATNHPFSVWDYATRSFVIKPGDVHRPRRHLRRSHRPRRDHHRRLTPVVERQKGFRP